MPSQDNFVEKSFILFYGQHTILCSAHITDFNLKVCKGNMIVNLFEIQMLNNCYHTGKLFVSLCTHSALTE